MVAKTKKSAKAGVAKKASSKASKAKSVAASKKTNIVVKESLTKNGLLTMVSENTGLNRKQVSSVLDVMGSIIEGTVKKNGVGQFTWPGLIKVMVVKKPATKARKGINPFTGEETVFKAKPARNVVKIRALKRLKDAAV